MWSGEMARANTDTPEANRRVLADSYPGVPTGSVPLSRYPGRFPHRSGCETKPGGKAAWRSELRETRLCSPTCPCKSPDRLP